MTAVVLALLAGACFAVSTVAQHRAASGSGAASHSGVRLLIHLCRRPLWLAGLLAGTAGLLLQGLAVSSGSLVVVQPLLVTGLLLALPLGVLVERRRPPRREWLAALAVVVGLATFLVAAAPRPGRQVAEQVPLAISTAAAAAAVLAAVLASATVGRRHRAALLGLGGGACFGVLGALLKQVARQGVDDPSSLVTTWAPPALAVAGVAGMVLAQASYQAGSLAASQPALTIAEPVVAAAIGAVAFAEHLASSPVALCGQVAGSVVMIGGVIALSALDRAAAPPPTPPPRGAGAASLAPSGRPPHAPDPHATSGARSCRSSPDPDPRTPRRGAPSAAPDAPRAATRPSGVVRRVRGRDAS